jgi:hypothetical protein
MDPDPTFGGKCAGSVMQRTELSQEPVGDRMIGLARLTYEVTYYTDARMPDSSALDDLETIDTKTSIGGAQVSADQAEDRIEVAP